MNTRQLPSQPLSTKYKLVRLRYLRYVLLALTFVCNVLSAEQYVSVFIGNGEVEQENFSFGPKDPASGNSSSNGQICYVFICGTLATSSSSSAATEDDLSLDDQNVFGGRYGRWFPSVKWLGMSVDVTAFSLDGKYNNDVAFDGDIYKIGLYGDIRFGFGDKNTFDGGKYQVYAGVHLFSFLSSNLSFRSKTTNRAGEFDETYSFGPSFSDYRIGLLYKVNPQLGVFSEYRVFDYEISHNSGGATFNNPKYTYVDITLPVEQLVVGVQYQF